MKKTVLGLIAAALLSAGALAQGTAAALEPQFAGLDASLKAVQKLANDPDNKISVGQAQLLLPYLREVRALSALTADDAAFYAQAIQRILTPRQLEVAGLRSEPATTPGSAGASVGQGVTGGGAGGGSSASLAGMTVASNPFREGDLVTSLDNTILTLTARTEQSP